MHVLVLVIACLLCFYTCIVADDRKSQTLSKAEYQRLRDFFEDTYIQKVRGFKENLTVLRRVGISIISIMCARGVDRMELLQELLL